MADRIAWGLLSAVLVTAAITDWRTGKIFNWLTYPAILAGLIYWVGVGFLQHGAAGATAGFENAALGLAAGILPSAVLVGMGGLGGGDVKLFGAVGALSGRWECVLGTAFYGFFLALLLAIAVMIRRGLVRQTFRRIFGALLTIVGGAKADLPTDSPRIPLAVPLGIGGILAGAEWLLHVRIISGNTW